MIAFVVEVCHFLFEAYETVEKVIIPLVGQAGLDFPGYLPCEGFEGEELGLHVLQEGEGYLDSHI